MRQPEATNVFVTNTMVFLEASSVLVGDIVGPAKARVKGANHELPLVSTQ